ncbi:hypothetical protein Ae168Ps1_3673c [Pseudonocardia sp. Ae168_Ps1]|nr:hypothetical protein Ae168Ps1_3673c [Pseudonocardia sp. Ae168_Ps1]
MIPVALSGRTHFYTARARTAEHRGPGPVDASDAVVGRGAVVASPLVEADLVELR